LYDITLGEFGMEDRLKKTRNMTLADRGLRLLVAGGTILLFLIVLVDAFGARSRAVAAMERARTQPPVEETRTATVPSVYSVPRDLASEAAMQRQLAAAAPAEEALEELAAPEVAQATEDAPQDVATEEAVEDAAAPEVAETEVAETEVAETEATEGAPQDLAAEDAAEETTAPEVAEAEATEDAPQDVAAEDDALALLASADIANGENVWRQCRACHVHDAEQNRGGPYLLNIIGREIGVAEGWRYSRALAEHDGVWTVEALLAWLENPDTYIPGNQMAFRGLRNEQDRIDVLGFLNASRTN